MHDNQRHILETPFRPEQIRYRAGSYGTTLAYVETHSVIERLNEAFAAEWSFCVLEHHVREDLDEVLVLGKLSAQGIHKMQIGSARLKRQLHGGELLGLGDDLKAAVSDCLKKCATLLGVGLHLYRKEPGTGDQVHAASEPQDSTTSTALKPSDKTPQMSETTDTDYADGSTPSPQSTSQSASRPPKKSRPCPKDPDPMSTRQKSLISNLRAQFGLEEEVLNRFCLAQYGRPLQALSKPQASHLIDALYAGGLQAA